MNDNTIKNLRHVPMEFFGFPSGVRGATVVRQQSEQVVAPGTVHVYAIPVGENYSELSGGSVRIVPGTRDWKSAAFSSMAGHVPKTPSGECSSWGENISMNFDVKPSRRGKERCKPEPREGLIYWNIAASSSDAGAVRYKVQYGMEKT